jgi:hypothetical protein
MSMVGHHALLKLPASSQLKRLQTSGTPQGIWLGIAGAGTIALVAETANLFELLRSRHKRTSTAPNPALEPPPTSLRQRSTYHRRLLYLAIGGAIGAILARRKNPKIGA